MRLSWGERLFMGLSLVVLVVPIMVVCAAALNGGRSMTFPPQDPALGRFVEFFVSEPVWVTALQNSAILAISSAALAVLIAWPIAYLLWQGDSRASKWLAAAATLPFAVPPMVTGVGMGFLWAWLGGAWHALGRDPQPRRLVLCPASGHHLHRPAGDRPRSA